MFGEINYEELFGVKLSEEPEVAEPEEAEEPEGANEPEDLEEIDAEPDELSEEDPGEEEEPAEPEEKGKEPKQKQSAEENARYAAARRKAEQERDAAIAEARREADEKATREMDQMVKALKLQDPYTKKTIETKAEYDQYMKRVQEDEKAKMQKRLGWTDEQYQQFVQTIPEVQKANETMQQAQAARKQAIEANARAAVAADLAEIGKLDPSIKSLQDLAKIEEYPAIVKRVQEEHMRVLDAYKLETWSRQMEKRSAAAQQAATNRQRSKDHLRKTAERGTGSEPVPSDVVQMYRDMMPGITDAEIRKHYNRKK